MPNSFHLTEWLRRHPLTVLLLVATLCVDAVVFAIDPERDHLIGLTEVSLVLSQLGLLAWWSTAPNGISWLRLIVLGLAIGVGTFFISDMGHMISHQMVLSWLFVPTIAILASSWLGWRFFNFNSQSSDRKSQFSLRQLLGVTTLCAVVAALSQYGDYSEFTADLVSFSVFGCVILLGIAGPALVFLSRWPHRVRWILPLPLGFALAIVASSLVSDLAEIFWILNLVAAATYSLYGLCIGLDAERLKAIPTQLEPCDSPPLGQDDYSPKKVIK